jgi:hypothetical protein
MAPGKGVFLLVPGDGWVLMTEADPTMDRAKVQRTLP